MTTPDDSLKRARRKVMHDAIIDAAKMLREQADEAECLAAKISTSNDPAEYAWRCFSAFENVLLNLNLRGIARATADFQDSCKEPS